jgi:hypothetical protein
MPHSFELGDGSLAFAFLLKVKSQIVARLGRVEAT